MINSKYISVIIVTHDNFSTKSGCIKSVLLSISQQQYCNYEIIIIDNASKSNDKKMLYQITQKVKNIRLVSSDINNIAMARNIGAEIANGEYLLFMDDDTVLTSSRALHTVSQYFNEGHYGYAANRYWTKPYWYEKNIDFLEDSIQKDDMSGIIFNIPDPQTRGKDKVRHLVKSYIGNFGFVHKGTLFKIGGWNESYIGYGCEDDELAFMLYMEYGRPVLLRDIDILHIWHPLKTTNYLELEQNQRRFRAVLDQHSVKIFHIGRLLYGEETVLDYQK